MHQVHLKQRFRSKDISNSGKLSVEQMYEVLHDLRAEERAKAKLRAEQISGRGRFPARRS